MIKGKTPSLKCLEGKASPCKPKALNKQARNGTKTKIEKLQTKEKQSQRKQATEALGR